MQSLQFHNDSRCAELFGVSVSGLRFATGTRFSYRDIKNGDIPYMNDTLMFFVFSRDTLNKYSWEEIKRDYKILKRIDITGRELDDQDWTITNP